MRKTKKKYKIERIQLHRHGASEIATLSDEKGSLSFEIVKKLDKKLIEEYYNSGGKLIMPREI